MHDTGLVAMPGPFRRLPGGLRHHQGRGAAWPDAVELELDADELVVPGVGSWPRGDVTARVLSSGPPVTFIVEVPGGAHLLAAPADDQTARLLAALGS